MDTNTVEIAIIGGGIGGLTTAIALQQRGIEAHVFEAARALREAGAGIWMPSNAMQVFGRLKLATQIEHAGAQLTSIQLQDFQHGPLTTTDLTDVATQFDYTTTAIHRGRLQQLLADQLNPERLHLAKRCRRLTQNEDHVAITFEDETTITARLVIGADGLRSTVRQQLFPTAQTRYSGQSSVRAVVPFRLDAPFARAGVEVWGRGCRFGFSGISAEETYWYATFDAPANEPFDSQTAKIQLGQLAENFPAPVLSLVQATPHTSLIRADIHDLQPISCWHMGRVVLMGDAAHATTPNLGQGGAQAIEDAYVLATAIAEQSTYQAAYAHFEKVRRAKAISIVNQSLQLGKLAHLHNPALRWLRDTAMRLTPSAVGKRQFASLYTLNF